MGVTWKVTPTQAFVPGVAEYVAAIRKGVRAIADRYAPEIEAHMKSTASWTDRSSNARQTLTAVVEEIALDMVSVIMAHGMEYGVYLEGFTPEGRETQQGGRYAIIAPTIDVFGPRIWADVQAMLR